MRQILQKDRDAALLRKDAEFARERDALQKKISDMSRRVKKGAGEIGEGAEIDLYDELRGAFPEDQIARVKAKGGREPPARRPLQRQVRRQDPDRLEAARRVAAGVRHASCARTRATTGADHAILSTPMFPAGKKELFVDSGVIVVAPARVRAIVEVLRKALIAMHVAKLSDAERAGQAEPPLQVHHLAGVQAQARRGFGPRRGGAARSTSRRSARTTTSGRNAARC